MAAGIVKWFNSAKGYGFICPAEGGQDVFAHFSSIVMDGYKCLRAGQKISFDVHNGPKGLHAINIQSLEDDTLDKTIKESMEKELSSPVAVSLTNEEAVEE